MFLYSDSHEGVVNDTHDDGESDAELYVLEPGPSVVLTYMVSIVFPNP